MENILESIIKKKVFSQKNVVSYISTPVVLDVTSANFYMDLGNDFYFLVTKSVSAIPNITSLKISSSDNFVTLTPTEYATYSLFQYASFRDYLEIDLTMPQASSFKSYKLEFLKVTPTYTK